DSQAVYVSFAHGDDDNAGTPDKPVKTIIRGAMLLRDRMNGNAGGGTIYLLPGEHPWVGHAASGSEVELVPISDVRDRWLTITRAPGAKTSEVRIVGPSDSGGLRAHLVRLHGVTVSAVLSTASLNSTNENP